MEDRHMKLWVLAGAVLVLNVADYATTRIGLAAGGTEVNPLMVEAYTSWAATAIKLGYVPLALFAIVALGKRVPRLAYGALAVWGSVYVFVVVNNLSVLRAG